MQDRDRVETVAPSEVDPLQPQPLHGKGEVDEKGMLHVIKDISPLMMPVAHAIAKGLTNSGLTEAKVSPIGSHGIMDEIGLSIRPEFEGLFVGLLTAFKPIQNLLYSGDPKNIPPFFGKNEQFIEEVVTKFGIAVKNQLDKVHKAKNP